VIVFVGLTAIYLGLDRLSFFNDIGGVGITPWNPAAGCAFAILLAFGSQYFWELLVSTFVSSLYVTKIDVLVPLVPAFAAAALVAGTYTGSAIILRRVAQIDIGLTRLQDLVWLLLVTFATAAIVAVSYVGVYVAAGLITSASFAEAVAQFWVGDVLGIVVLTPPLLIANAYIRTAIVTGRPIFNLRGPLLPKITEHAFQLMAIAGALSLIFLPSVGRGAFRFFYFLFMPLIWIAVRHGLPGASVAIAFTQVGLLAVLEYQAQSNETVRIFQLLMLTLTATVLLLGAVVGERRRSQNALAQTEDRIHDILASTPDGVVTVDPNGIIESFNEGAEAIFGISAEKAIGWELSRLLPLPALMERVMGIASNAKERGYRSVSGIELSAKGPDGIELPVEVTAGWMKSTPHTRYTLVIRDITLRKQHANRLKERESALLHSSRLSVAGEMASGIAHELNQPLTAILAYAQGCKRIVAEGETKGSAPHGLGEAVKEIAEQAERAGQILNRMREFLREGASHLSTIEIEQVVEDTLGLVSSEAMQKGVKLINNVRRDLPPILSDGIQIEQVLVNLVRNGVDAASGLEDREAIVSIGAQVVRDGFAMISVSDSGPGVLDSMLPRLFHPFATSKPQGMGLGLSICRTIVEAHGGKLKLTTNGPDGATFSFTVPIKDPADDR